MKWCNGIPLALFLVMNVLYELLAHFRHCPCCRKSLGRIEWLCDSCLEKFVLRVRSTERKTILIKDKIPLFYLVDWKPEDPFMTAAVHSLKGGKLSWAYQMLSEMFLLKHIGLSKRGTIVYPTKGLRDHAFEWSLALAQQKDMDFIPLELLSQKKQALLSRGERLAVGFKPLKLPRNSSLILADDIVTSGATAHAAWLALGRPKSFAIWSIFYRRSL